MDFQGARSLLFLQSITFVDHMIERHSHVSFFGFLMFMITNKALFTLSNAVVQGRLLLQVEGHLGVVGLVQD